MPKSDKKVEKIRLADNELTYGISFKKISYDYLKKLLNANFINKIETYSSEFISFRGDIIDLNKLLFYEFLYQKFNNHLFLKILDTKFITTWNRKNPTKTIDELTKFNESFLKEKLEGIYILTKYLFNYYERSDLKEPVSPKTLMKHIEDSLKFKKIKNQI